MMSNSSECAEGRRLYNAYMIELGHWGILLRSAEPDLHEATECRQRLMRAREQYRKHVDEHHCRRRLPSPRFISSRLAS